MIDDQAAAGKIRERAGFHNRTLTSSKCIANTEQDTFSRGALDVDMIDNVVFY
jgi:hypothetical protein